MSESTDTRITLTHPSLGAVEVNEADADLFRLAWRLSIPAVPIARPASNNVEIHFADTATLELFLNTVANHLGATPSERLEHPIYQAMTKPNGPREWRYFGQPCDASAYDGTLPASFTVFSVLYFPRSHYATVLAALERAVRIATVPVVSAKNYDASKFRADC